MSRGCLAAGPRECVCGAGMSLAVLSLQLGHMAPRASGERDSAARVNGQGTHKHGSGEDVLLHVDVCIISFANKRPSPHVDQHGAARTKAHGDVTSRGLRPCSTTRPLYLRPLRHAVGACIQFCPLFIYSFRFPTFAAGQIAAPRYFKNARANVSVNHAEIGFD